MFGVLKRLLVGSKPGPYRVRYGIASGATFNLDPAKNSQRVLGLGELEIAPAFARGVKGIKTFVDIGASDGFYGIVAMRLNPDVQVVACEPQAHYEAEARANVRLNFPDASRMTWMVRTVGAAEPSVSLDSLVRDRPGPVLVKIDVEGAEVEVIKSGESLLGRNDARYLIEVHAPELEKEAIALLESRGFRCEVVDKAWWRRIVPELRPTPFNRWLYAEKAAAG